MGCPNGRHASKDDSALVIKNKDIKEQEKLFEAKVVLLGDQHVGKSNIALRYCKSTFSSQHITTIGGAYFQQKVILSNGASIKLHIWDTGGQDRFRAMANLYYRDAQAAILTYDVTNETSFSSLDYWIQELSEKANAKSNSILLVLAGNKCDLPQIDKKVLTTRAKEFAEANQMIFYETSAKNNIGITELFHSIAKRIYEIRGGSTAY